MPGYYICRELIKNNIFGKRFNIGRRLPGRLSHEHVSQSRKTAQISEVISIRENTELSRGLKLPARRCNYIF